MTTSGARVRRRRPIPGPLSGRHDGIVLSLLRDRGPISRSSIAEITGMSPTTVTKAVAPLVEAGFVREGTAADGTRIGRPAIALHLVPEAATVCGIQIGVGTVRAAIVDALGQEHASTSFGFDPTREAEEVLGEIAARVDRELLGEADPIAVGVAAPGVVEADGRTNSLSINLGWSDVPIADVFEDVTGLPTVAEHNVSAMALGENRYGSKAVSIAFVYVRTGVGLGLVLRGEPFVGGRHGVSELGHVHVSDDGAPCPCGSTGCLEAEVAEPALDRILAELGTPRADPSANPLRLLERAAASGGAAAHARGRVVKHLAAGIASVVNLFSPDTVIIGGVLDDIDVAFLDDLDRETRIQVFPLLRDSLKLEQAPRGASSGVVGAAAVALERFVFGIDGS